MMELVVVHPHIFWLSLDGLLLAVEMLGGNDYLLWNGAVVVITSLAVWLLPPGQEWQRIMFAVLILFAAQLWWGWLSRRVREQKHSDSHLNQRGQQLVGRHFVLEFPLVSGRDHIYVGDGSWPVSASEDLGAGMHVEVIAIEGITLIVRAVVTRCDADASYHAYKVCSDRRSDKALAPHPAYNRIEAKLLFPVFTHTFLVLIRIVFF